MSQIQKLTVLPLSLSGSEERNIWEIKTEGVLGYDSTIHRQSEPYFEPDKGSVIRFREVGVKRSAPQSGQEIEPKVEKKIESNARLVKWSDGSLQLAVGAKLYNLQDSSSRDAYLFQNEEGVRGVAMARNQTGSLETQEVQKNVMIYKAPIVRRLIPSIANEEDALQFAKLVRKTSQKLKIKTEEIMNVQEKSEVLKKFQNVPMPENELSNSNTLERIKELQRKSVYQTEGRGAMGVGGDGYEDEENDFIFDGEVEEDGEDYEEGDQEEEEDDQFFSSEEEEVQYKKNVIEDEESEAEEKKEKEEQEDSEDDSDVIPEDNAEEEEEVRKRPIRRSTRLNRRGGGEEEELLSLNQALERQINEEGEGHEEIVSQDEEEEEEIQESEEEEEQQGAKEAETKKEEVQEEEDFNVDDVIAEVEAKQEN